MDNDGGVYTNEHLLFVVDWAEYIGKKVLAMPRCYSKRKGTQDCKRVNNLVAKRDRDAKEEGNKREPILARREIGMAKQKTENVSVLLAF
jgi:hypothetical protein